MFRNNESFRKIVLVILLAVFPLLAEERMEQGEVRHVVGEFLEARLRQETLWVHPREGLATAEGLRVDRPDERFVKVLHLHRSS